MSMSRYGLETIMFKMVELMGAEEVLKELSMALSTDELEDNLEFIDRMNDLNLFEDEDEEEDYYYV